jgi:hypothetical protein
MNALEKTSAKDIAHILAKVALSTIPAGGGPAVELFQWLIQSPREKRLTEWMNDVGEKLQALEKTGFNLDELQENERFISAVMHASQLAARTHQNIKREALRNAILNIGLSQDLDETMEYLFFRYIDELSEMHFRMLEVFQKPTLPPGIASIDLKNIIKTAIPELNNRENIFHLLWKNLSDLGLITTSMNIMYPQEGYLGQLTTDLGDELLKFIKEPPETQSHADIPERLPK